MNRKPCPTCRRPSTEAYAPFCTKRCADVDLQRWFSGAYALPPGDKDEEDSPRESDLPDEA